MFWTIFLVLLFDLFLGEPVNILHPTVWIGKLISFFERFLYYKNGIIAKINGVILVLFVISIAGFIAYFAEIGFLKKFSPTIANIAIAMIASMAIACRSLVTHVIPILRYIVSFRKIKARKSLSMIVGRETKGLNVSEISRATIESLAESLGDGIISPLFYFTLFGLPGIFIYRAVNTMDSMIGYKSEKYINFGWAAAKLDDFLNYLPSRLIGFTSILLSAIILKLNYIAGFKCAIKEQANHNSPSAGWFEATVAGCLNIRLGGKNSYKNKNTKTFIFNETGNKTSPKDIVKTIKIIVTAAVIATVELAIIKSLLIHFV